MLGRPVVGGDHNSLVFFFHGGYIGKGLSSTIEAKKEGFWRSLPQEFWWTEELSSDKEGIEMLPELSGQELRNRTNAVALWGQGCIFSS